MTVTVDSTASLLADPANVALLRDLITHARRHGAQHLTYFGFTNGPLEHKWRLGVAEVSVFNGEVFHSRHGDLIFKSQVDSPRQVAQLLAAIGVLPPRFAVTAEQVAAMAPDIRWTATPGGAK